MINKIECKQYIIEKITYYLLIRHAGLLAPFVCQKRCGLYSYSFSLSFWFKMLLYFSTSVLPLLAFSVSIHNFKKIEIQYNSNHINVDAKGNLRFLVPSEEKFIEFESKAWLRFLTRSSNFVSIDSAGNSYLPIFMPASNSASANTISTPIPSSTNNNTSNNNHFPGQGIRLGS